MYWPRGQRSRLHGSGWMECTKVSLPVDALESVSSGSGWSASANIIFVEEFQDHYPAIMCVPSKGLTACHRCNTSQERTLLALSTLLFFICSDSPLAPSGTAASLLGPGDGPHRFFTDCIWACCWKHPAQGSSMCCKLDVQVGVWRAGMH